MWTTATPPMADSESRILWGRIWKGKEDVITSATIGSLQHRWPNAWSRVH